MKPLDAWRRAVLIVILAAVMIVPGQALEPGEILKDPVLEARARVLSAELRCLVCQNQSIDDSDAPLAKDLRLIIRDRLTKGDSNDQVMDFVVARYGEFVLLKPRFAPHTWILWLTAPFLLVLGIIAVVIRQRRISAEAVTAPLSRAEKAALKKILK